MEMITVLAFLSLLLCHANCQQRDLKDVKPEELTFFIPAVPTVSIEQLKDVLTRAYVLREKAKREPAVVAAAIAAAAGTLPPINFNQAFRVLKALPAEVQMHLPATVDLLARIRGLGTSAECRKRLSVPGLPEGRRVLIAANLNDCEEIMPYWLLEVLRLVLLMREDPIMQAIYTVPGRGAGAGGGDQAQARAQAQAEALAKLDLSRPPDSRVGISVYESGSTDATPVWLKVAEALWGAAGIPTTLVVNGTLTRQMKLLDPSTGKQYKQHRIQHLSNLRNAALEPLYKQPGSYDHVFFINDIFFCAPDLLRLTYLQADIACGLDVEVWIGGHVPKIRDAGHRNRGRLLRRRLAQVGAGTAGSNGDGGGGAAAAAAAVADAGTVVAAATGSNTLSTKAANELLASWKAALELMTKVHTSEAERQHEANLRVQEAVIKPRYEFYDIWVARDIGGSAFIKHDPIARDMRTARLLHRGMPFPVKCCWNGAVFFNASHLSAGLRFRTGMRSEGECDASECSIFCEDYRRLGSGKVAIDPSVRVSYAPWTEAIHGPLPGGVPAKVPWTVAYRNGALEQLQALWQETKDDMWVECVPLRKGFDGADLDRVRRVDIRTENYTALFLERLRQPSPPPSRACNLMMGSYGAVSDGEYFDDLSYASWGKNPIRRIVHSSGEFVNSIQVVYGSTPAKQHGSGGGELRENLVEPGEHINTAAVFFDEAAIHGIELNTSVGRRIVIGHLREGVSRAKASPCPADPAHEGRYRLIGFAGTADRYLRSITLFWS